MADIFPVDKRSEVMSRIKSSNTKPEILVRKFLFLKGFRFRINDRSLPGTPDIKLTKYKTVVMINGCFWHGHSCRKNPIPKSNIQFWQDKIERNKNRDLTNLELLKRMGWRVITVWECELTTTKRNETLDRLVTDITSYKSASPLEPNIVRT